MHYFSLNQFKLQNNNNNNNNNNNDTTLKNNHTQHVGPRLVFVMVEAKSNKEKLNRFNDTQLRM